ncbi:MAG TPA: hypothetical protein VK737_04095 [Opitutales bacterium]|nr:hypothetical protein [Opitutales bacterium]
MEFTIPQRIAVEELHAPATRSIPFSQNFRSDEKGGDQNRQGQQGVNKQANPTHQEQQGDKTCQPHDQDSLLPYFTLLFG